MPNRLIAGCMSWGQWGQQWSTAQMAQAIADCLDVGIHRFDHAAIYGGYTTEAEFGAAFAAGGFDRSKVELISKCGIQYVSDNSPYTIKHYDYSAVEIRRSTEQSLRNLRTDYLDVLLLHRPSPLLDPSEVADTLGQLMAEGKVKKIGVSNFTPSQIELLQARIPLAFHQLEVSITHSAPMTQGDLDSCLRWNIHPMAWRPLGQYFKSDDPQVQRLKAVVPPMAEQYGLTEDALLIAWLLLHPAGIQPVLGTTQKSRWQAAVQATQRSWKLEDWFALWVAALGHKVP